MKKNYILELYKNSQTILTARDIALIWGETNLSVLKSRINYYVKTNKLLSLRRGIYAKNKDYELFELATKIYTPSYVSLETKLAESGVIFQYYQGIFVVSYLAREVVVDGQRYIFKKIKNEALMSIIGIDRRNNYSIATTERAFLDTLYLYKNYHFDNLKILNWDLVYKILPIYSNKSLAAKVNSLYKGGNVA